MLSCEVEGKRRLFPLAAKAFILRKYWDKRNE
jgi:hypothetical protein